MTASTEPEELDRLLPLCSFDLTAFESSRLAVTSRVRRSRCGTSGTDARCVVPLSEPVVKHCRSGRQSEHQQRLAEHEATRGFPLLIGIAPLRAAKSALAKVEQIVLADHLGSSIEDAIVRGDPAQQREKVVADMKELLNRTKGDSTAGVAVFKKLCAQCHKIYGEGQDVGPDITSNGRSTFDQLLSNVFDPGLVIRPQYQVTIVVTRDGRNLTGLVAADSDQPIAVRISGEGDPAGARVLREAVSAFRGPDVSADEERRWLGLACRASLARYLEPDDMFAVTKQGLDFYVGLFRTDYPFAKYDQVFAPEFPAGAMENVACVVISEQLLFRSKVTDLMYEMRAMVILHEMAHMWFGDLVTMRWWDDLWLNESFATWASVVSQAEATEYLVLIHS